METQHIEDLPNIEEMFKSYYVVWKQFCPAPRTFYIFCLNRTM